jgi:hypothetical protein
MSISHRALLQQGLGQPSKTQAERNQLRREQHSVFLGKLLLVAVPLINVLWYPLATVNIEAELNITPLDVVLITSWVLSILLLVKHRSHLSKSEKLAWQIVMLANVPVVLSPLAAVLAANGSNVLVGLFVHLKRLGMASILVPLAVQCRLYRVQGAVALLIWQPSDLGLDATLVTEFQATTGRSAGLVYNPNTLGSVTGMFMLFLSAYISLRRNFLINLLLLTGIGVSLALFLSAASRTAAIALLAPIVYLVVKRRSRLLAVALPWLLAAAIVFLANSESVQQSLFVSRFGEIQSDQNLATRLDVQSRALSQIGNWPLGTGIGNLGLGVFGLPVTLSTTDSLYVDYLTGMGWLGLISIIGLLLLIWRALASPERTSMIAKSVLIYGTIFSLSGAGLASNFVSPIFFLIVGLALSATSSDKNDCLDVAMVSDAAYA